MNSHGGERSPAATPDLWLERYRLGELPPADTARLGSLLAHDQQLRDRLQALERDDGRLDAAQTIDRLAQDVAARARRLRPAPARPWPARAARWAVPAAVAAALVAVVLRPAVEPRSAPPTEVDGERAKGTSALVVYRSTDSGSETLSNDELVRVGDVVRIGYRSTTPEYGAIVSVDGRGVTTVHLPVTGDRAVVLEPGNTVLLDRAFELDDAPLYERFYLVTGPAPFDVAPVLDAVRRSAAAGREPGPLHLPLPLGHTEFSLRKESRP